ncbi:MAG: hypothetical protein FJ395_09450 [Verrucomicrobia bacterium]|nr:hypothetical protein [Verrucomicrobiota bacterium]
MINLKLIVLAVLFAPLAPVVTRVAARKPGGHGAWCVCQVLLAGRIAGNPVAEIFARRLLAQ